jgi:hypothetical protein
VPTTIGWLLALQLLPIRANHFHVCMDVCVQLLPLPLCMYVYVCGVFCVQCAAAWYMNVASLWLFRPHTPQVHMQFVTP